jgi:nicotinamide riboside transporter PnuC
MVVSVVGAWLVARVNIVGYYFWLVSNLGWVVVNVYYEIYGQAAMSFVFLLLTAYGILQWKRKFKEVK